MAEILARTLTAAARTLALAGQWAQAASLLSSAVAGDAAERAVLAVAEAEVAVDQDFWCRTDRGSSALSRARSAVADAPDDVFIAFDLEFLQLRHSYATELFGPNGGPRFGPAGRDPAVIDDLAARAGRLRAGAPDRGRGAAATFYAGLIADNLRGDAAAARPMFAAALEAADDDLTESEALRHLGYHLGEDGEAEQARQMWERSAELRQRAGAVPYVLSQQLLLAGLARKGGSLEEARVVAGQVRRWARALGVGVLEAGAAELEAGAADLEAGAGDLASSAS
jgi:tetratricopeptide (TPR) repeat protein